MAQLSPGRRLKIVADVMMAVIAVTIVFLTLFYASKTPSSPILHDKIYHAIAFFALVFPGAMVHRWTFLWLVPLAIGFGAAIEYIKPYFGRHREIADLYADIAGVLGGVIVGTLVRLWWRSGLCCTNRLRTGLPLT